MDHIRSCLVRNGFPNVASNNNSTVSDADGDSEKLGERSASSDIEVTNDEAKQLILEVVTKKNTHVIEELLLRYATRSEGCRTPWALPVEVQAALDALAPLFRFLYGDFEKTTMQEFLTTNFVLIPDDPYSRAIEWLLDRIRFTLWCIDRDFVGPNWTPKSLLELCTEQASDLASLKILGGLHQINEEEIHTLLSSQPSSLDVFKGLKAIITFIHYIYKHLNSVMANSTTAHLEDVERLLIDIKSPELCLEVMEDLFALCFLRREHVVFEETASDSAEAGEEAAADEPDNSKTKKYCDQLTCPSNSNTSPNNTSQTGNSSTSALCKGNLSFGFLCHDPDKLQAFLQMLKRRLEALDLASSNSQSQPEELSKQRRKLDQHVSEALWRLELVVDGDWTTNYFTTRSGDSASSVRKAWIARLTPAVQLWYGGYQQIQQQGRRCNPMKTKINKTKRSAGTTDPMLMNRLLAQPVSLMVMSMTKSRLSAAKQVADLYQLWGTPEGKELGRSLAHATAVQDLQRVVASQKIPSSPNADPGESDIIEGLNHIRLPSAIELLLSKLEQMEDNQLEEPTSIILLADLVCSSVFSPPEMGVQLLNFVLDRAKAASLDVTQEQPWRTLRHLVECSSLELQDSSKWVSPLRSSLPLDAKQRRDRIDRLDQIDRQLRELMVLLEKRGSIELAATAFEDLSGALQALQPASKKNEATFLLGMSKYLRYLRQLVPIRMQEYSVSELFKHDLATLILERLKNEMEVSDEVEASAQLIGIDLVSFLARRLCSATLEPVDFTDEKFIKLLLSYFHSRSPLLAQVVDTTLEVERGVSFLDKELKIKDCGYNMDIFRRFLQRPSRFAKQETTPSEVPQDNLPRKNRSSNLLPTTTSPVAALLSSPSPEQEESTQLADLILEMIPSTVRSQIQLLVSNPLLLVEQLLMNCQMGLASDIVKLVRKHSESGEELNELLLRYAAKALVLGLPELPSSTTAARFKDSVKTSIKTKKKSTSFVLPAIVPSKDQWVDDAEVSLCPCCQAVEFSMFDRRHHCRRCGRVVCSHCSPHRRLVEGYGDVPVRTCVDCFNFLLERPDQTASSSTISIRSTDKDGQILWQLSLLDSQHNFIARREFSYEHAPNLALALAMVNLCQDSGSGDLAANFLLDQSSSMLATLHRYLLHGALLDVCSDPLMMFSLIKSLILSAKMRYSEIIAAPPSAKTTSSPTGGNLPKSKPARGLARCDALLGQIDLLSLLSSANCLHLLPPQPLAQLDTWRKLRDRLIEVELWSLALDVSTKAGLDAGSVWAAWGLVCLKTGNFQGARQRFQRCLKPAKKSPLLQEIVSVLENLSIPSTSTPLSGSSRSLRRLSSSSSTINAGAQMPEILSSDSPQLITASLARLNDICNGHLCEMEEKGCTLEEILFYLDTYGEPEAPFAYLVEKSCRIDLAVQRYTASRSHSNTDVFNQGLLLPCLRSSRLEDLIVEMKRHDSSFHSWKNHFLAAAQLLETKLFWNCLYQFHCLTGDWIRAALVAIRRLFLSDLFSVETLVARTHLLEDVSSHLTQYLGRQIAQPPEGTPNDKQMPLWWPSMEVITLRKRVQLQLKVTAFLDACLKEGKLSGTLISVVQSVTQSPNIITLSSGEFQVNPSNVFLVPTLLGSRQYRCSSAVLVTCAGPESPAAFELSWRICNELRVRLDRYFRLSAFVLIRQGQVTAVIQLIQFLKARMTDQSIGFFDVDELLVECATLTQDRDKESKSPDTELIVQQIRQPACKIRAFINLGWLKAAYLLAVKNGLVADVIHIQQEATRLEQTAVLTLCDKWLRARNLAK